MHDNPVALKVNEEDLELSIGGMPEPSNVIDGYRITLKEVVAPIPWSGRILIM